MAKSKTRGGETKKWSLGDYYEPYTGVGPDYTEFHVQNIDYASKDKNRINHWGRVQVYSDPAGEAEKIAEEIVKLLNEKFND